MKIVDYDQKVLVLSASDAEWLRGALQNPLGVLSEVPEHNERQYALWQALGGLSGTGEDRTEDK